MKKIKMSKVDWESLAFVLDHMKPSSFDLPQIVFVEKAVEKIQKALEGYVVERDAIIQRGQKLIAKFEKHVKQLKIKYAVKDTDEVLPKEIIGYIEASNREINEKVNTPLRESYLTVKEIEFEDKHYETMRKAFLLHADFGPTGYNDNMDGKDAFLRTLIALDIKPEELDNARKSLTPQKPEENLEKK